MMYGRGYGYGGGPMMGGAGLFGAFIGLVFFGLLIALVVLLIMWAVRAGSPGHRHDATTTTSTAKEDEAMAIARKRLANGEITPEQYQEIAKHLGGGTGA